MAQESDCRYCAGKGFRDASQQLVIYANGSRLYRKRMSIKNAHRK